MVIIDEPASDRLLNESAIIEIEPLIIPAISFVANKNILKNIPIAPQRVPYAVLTDEDFKRVCAPIGIKIPGAKTPGEIAVSIAGQLITKRSEKERSSRI